MEPTDTGAEIILDKLENLCKDRFTGYVIVVMDGDNCWATYSSKLLALGAADYLKDVVQKEWDEE